MPRYYPINLELSRRLCVVIGGGSVATRRVLGLLDAGAKVKIVSPEISPELQGRANAGELEWIAAPYSADVLMGAALVFIATNRRDVNLQARTDAQSLGILVNAADDAESGDFVVPASFRRGDLILSIATGGATPAFAAEIRRELENRFGPEYAGYVELLGQMRDYIKETQPSEAKRRAAHSRLLALESELLILLRENRNADALARAKEEVEEKAEARSQKSEEMPPPASAPA